MDKKDPTSLYEALIRDHPRVATSLERVKEACDFLQQSRAPVTVTAAGNYCKNKWGGPAPQSIRNARDTVFLYLQTRQGQQSLPTSNKKTNQEPPIRDESIRAYVALLKAEKNEAVARMRRIENVVRTSLSLDYDELIQVGFSPAKTQIKTPQSHNLPEAAKAALRKLFDAQTLKEFGLELYKNRLRHKATGAILLDKSDVEILAGLLKDSPTEEGHVPAIAHQISK